VSLAAQRLEMQTVNQSEGIQMVPLAPGLKLYKPLTSLIQVEPIAAAPLSTGMVECDSLSVEEKLVQQLQRLFAPSAPSNAAQAMAMPENPPQIPDNQPVASIGATCRRWGRFRAPLRDYERVMTRIRYASGAVTRAALVCFIQSRSDEDRVQVQEKNIARLLLEYFDVILNVSGKLNHTVIGWSDVLTVVEKATELIDSAGLNPYILGLSDVEFESVKSTQV
jgi:hypothetical protein